MKKHLLILLATLILWLPARAADGDTFTVDNLKYTVISEENKTVGVSKGEIDPSGTLIIPDKVTNNSKIYTVVRIHDVAFRKCQNITSVIIPNTVVDIYNSAFHNCAKLESVVFGNSVEYIGGYAFFNCALRTVTVPKSVKEMGDFVFANYDYVGTLEQILVEEGNTKFSSDNVSLFNADKTLLIQYPQGRKGSYDIPATVKRLGRCVFQFTEGLDAVTIPNSITEISDYAFCGCSGLTSITIPENVTRIGDYAFSGCTGFTSITIPDKVTRMGGFVFHKCGNLHTIYAAPPSPAIIPEYTSTFYGVPTDAVVYVPVGSVGAYKEAYGWSELYDYREYEFSGIDEVEGEVIDAPVEYYMLNGQRVSAKRLAPGMYIRRQGRETTQIVVR